MPKLIALAALLASAWPAADVQAFSLASKKSFAAESYFCTTNSPALETTAQVRDWFAFLASGRAGELLEAAPGSASCNGAVQRALRDGIWHAEGPEALAQIIALAGFLDAPPDAPEQRLAHDVGVLGWLALACKTFTGEEQACVARAVRDLPQQGLAESPVFCDFAQVPPPVDFRARYEGFADGEAGFALCTPLHAAPVTGIAQDAWWQRVFTALSPMLGNEETEQ